MTTELERLLNAGEELLGRIGLASQAIREQLPEIEIKHALAYLAEQARVLQREIDGARAAAPHRDDPVAAASMQAIDNLITLLTEAKGYFAAGQNLAAIGTLVMFDDHAEDLKAAFRLCRMAQRRRS